MGRGFLFGEPLARHEKTQGGVKSHDRARFSGLSVPGKASSLLSFAGWGAADSKSLSAPDLDTTPDLDTALLQGATLFDSPQGGLYNAVIVHALLGRLEVWVLCDLWAI